VNAALLLLAHCNSGWLSDVDRLVGTREDGEWKIVHRHGDNPPPDQSPPMPAR
jgi:hypothetical protein